MKVFIFAVLIITLMVIGFILWIRYHVKCRKSKVNRDGKRSLSIGFFHPYCNAGGGGERVLWTAICAIQKRFPTIRCIVYTGDTSSSAKEIMSKTKKRFNIILPRDVEFVFLYKRKWVEAYMYPYFTLLGQSLGSLFLGLEAILKFVPDIYIDSMGYAFTLPLFRYIGGCTVSAYVHYPTVTKEMLQRVSSRITAHNNKSFISRSAVLSQFKLLYYKLFAFAYGLAGSASSVVMVNSSWTKNHILSLWKMPDRTVTLYPPCDTTEFLSLKLTDKSQDKVKTIVSVSQFRPEKDHPLQVQSFAKFLENVPKASGLNYKLVLVGSCRNEGDEMRVQQLKDLIKSLDIQESVEFKLNIPFDDLKQCLAEAYIGLHTMWNEHFGIGVVELMAAGTITLAHNSGGPKMDIVVPDEDGPTGFLADSVDSFSDMMKYIFNLSKEEHDAIVRRARHSVLRFSNECFDENFIIHILPLIQDLS